MTQDKTSPVHEAIRHIKSIAVIGAGPSGAGCVKALLKENKFAKIQAFEKRSNFGGLWNHTEETDAKTTPIPSEKSTLDIEPIFNEVTNEYKWASPVYDYLDTNVPKDIMTYADMEFPKECPVFPHRSDVLRYMIEYSKELIPYIRFDTKVVNVVLLPNNTWEVTSRPVVKETKGGKTPSTVPEFQDTVEIYDAVVIATGNYDVPYIPRRNGMEEWAEKFPGSITHVKSYRSPKQFESSKGKILVVGNSASGGDLAYQLATELQRNIYKSKRSENLLPAGKSDFIIDVPDIVNFNAEEKCIELKDGSKLEDVDHIIFATGYLKSFPFLNHLNDTEKPLLSDGHKVHGIYEHIILYNYPNLAIIGLARYVLPTRTSETQGCWLAKIWSGRIPLPSISEMQAWESDRVEKKGNGKQFHDLLFPEDVHYCNALNDQVLKSVAGEKEQGLIPKTWDKEQTSIRGSIKGIKEAYIQYKAKTGKLAHSYQELIDSKIIDSFMISDEDLKKKGFNF
ncbi:flavin-containing monooxygenase [Scheffersomyces xylosifermentans]|uniref:flavin-containing monooxygenase n=1 Tax=Scheffersomyces xylosifermentans TaxID=1304137 RepID=UPI00315CD463